MCHTLPLPGDVLQYIVAQLEYFSVRNLFSLQDIETVWEESVAQAPGRAALRDHDGPTDVLLTNYDETLHFTKYR